MVQTSPPSATWQLCHQADGSSILGSSSPWGLDPGWFFYPTGRRRFNLGFSFPCWMQFMPGRTQTPAHLCSRWCEEAEKKSCRPVVLMITVQQPNGESARPHSLSVCAQSCWAARRSLSSGVSWKKQVFSHLSLAFVSLLSLWAQLCIVLVSETPIGWFFITNQFLWPK